MWTHCKKVKKMSVTTQARIDDCDHMDTDFKKKDWDDIATDEKSWLRRHGHRKKNDWDDMDTDEKRWPRPHGHNKDNWDDMDT